ncbi:MAG: hypothetical protein Q7R40_03245 [Phaeospirillum sp.]|nr:hypothetical protein [Phaeospirillum sp.]
MAVLDDGDSKRLFDYLYQSLDETNASDLETFARSFLHNSKVWDLLAEHFPSATASSVRATMMEAFAAWQKAG